MAELAAQWPSSRPATTGALLEAGAAILGVAFLVKARCWPLNFWLPGTYGAAGAPVAAVFAILTKVGVYALLRLWLLLLRRSRESHLRRSAVAWLFGWRHAHAWRSAPSACSAHRHLRATGGVHA